MVLLDMKMLEDNLIRTLDIDTLPTRTCKVHRLIGFQSRLMLLLVAVLYCNLLLFSSWNH